MLRLSTTLLLVLIACFTINAQTSTFEKGYIIQNNDTIQGYIQNASDLDLSNSIQFKTDLNAANARTYSPTEIRAFHFEKTGFHFALVKAEVIKGSSFQQTNRFAKQLLSGYTNLYKLQLPVEEQAIVLQTQNTHLYILQKDSTYYTLGSYETQTGDVVRTNKRYVGVLRAAFSDCGNYTDDLNNLSFNDKSILAEVTKYNACKNPETQSITHAYKTKPVIKHGIEISLATLYVPNNTDNTQGYSYTAGYFWDIIKPDKSRKYSGKLGVSYRYLKYKYENIEKEQQTRNIHYIGLPLSTQYNFKDAVTADFIPFVNVGFTALFPTKVNSFDILPLHNIGIGMYYGRMKYALILDNIGLKFSDPKILNFSVGVRLD